jgi:hypothetical protein
VIGGEMRTANFCSWCADKLVGTANRRRLDQAIYKAGWIQLPLSFHPDLPSAN